MKVRNALEMSEIVLWYRVLRSRLRCFVYGHRFVTRRWVEPIRIVYEDYVCPGRPTTVSWDNKTLFRVSQETSCLDCDYNKQEVCYGGQFTGYRATARGDFSQMVNQMCDGVPDVGGDYEDTGNEAEVG